MKRETLTLGGKTVELETGRVARQADGAALVRQGGTIVLVTAVGALEARPDIGFFPLTVEYREKMGSAGKIPGGYLKREGRPGDHEILVARLIDRSIRPLFPDGLKNEVQVVATVLSFTPEADPDSLAILGAGLALHLSDIPWEGPCAGLRVARIDGRLVALPTREERGRADLDIVATGGAGGGLVMLEGEAREAPEADLLEAIDFADAALGPARELFERWRGEVGRAKRPLPPAPEGDIAAALGRKAREVGPPILEPALLAPVKKERRLALRSARAAATAALDAAAAADPVLGPAAEARGPAFARLVSGAVEDLERALVRERIAEQGLRLDGRRLDEIRPISSEVGWLPGAHGSALFTRGDTQAIVTCTLGGGEDQQIADTLHGETRERFLLHYNFPPYSVGEVKPMRGPGRREIGHGELAKRALAAVQPPEEAFAYVVRIDSEISESNGSSSMATVCGSTLALMDAGVPLRKPVAGIAMGLVAEGGRSHVLSDILGDEDHLGDMDFKVAGTADGVTAIQLDNKIGALPRDVLEGALDQARRGRLHILGEMAKALAAPRPEVAPNAPRIASFRIRRERIRELIGAGGKTIQGLQEQHGVRIEVDDTGFVKIYAPDQQSAEEARRAARRLTADPELGKVYKATVVTTKDFGAFVRFLSSTEGLVHISELAPERVGATTDVVKEGDEVLVRLLGVDKQGKLRLSRKAALNADLSEIAG